MIGVLHLVFSEEALNACLGRARALDVVVIMTDFQMDETERSCLRPDIRICRLAPEGFIDPDQSDWIDSSDLVELTVRYPKILSW